MNNSQPKYRNLRKCNLYHEIGRFADIIDIKSLFWILFFWKNLKDTYYTDSPVITAFKHYIALVFGN